MNQIAKTLPAYKSEYNTARIVISRPADNLYLFTLRMRLATERYRILIRGKNNLYRQLDKSLDSLRTLKMHVVVYDKIKVLDHRWSHITEVKEKGVKSAAVMVIPRFPRYSGKGLEVIGYTHKQVQRRKADSLMELWKEGKITTQYLASKLRQ